MHLIINQPRLNDTTITHMSTNKILFHLSRFYLHISLSTILRKLYFIIFVRIKCINILGDLMKKIGEIIK